MVCDYGLNVSLPSFVGSSPRAVGRSLARSPRGRSVENFGVMGVLVPGLMMVMCRVVSV